MTATTVVANRKSRLPSFSLRLWDMMGEQEIEERLEQLGELLALEEVGARDAVAQPGIVDVLGLQRVGDAGALSPARRVDLQRGARFNKRLQDRLIEFGCRLKACGIDIWVDVFPHVIHVARDVEEPALHGTEHLVEVRCGHVGVAPGEHRRSRALERRVDARVDAADREVVAMPLQVVADVAFVGPLVGDLDAEQDLDLVAEPAAQLFDHLHATFMRCQRRARLTGIEVEVVGDGDPRHAERDGERRVDVDRHRRVRRQERVQVHVERQIERAAQREALLAFVATHGSSRA